MKETIQYTNAIAQPIFKIIHQAGKELQLPVYVIGGYVRDYILQQKQAKDIDIVAIGSGIELAQKVASLLPHKHQINIYKNFGTAMIKSDDVILEFVGARKESYNRNSRKPIVENGSMADDQKRRDFTINALAISLNENDKGTLIDPFDGLEDLKMKIIRTPLDPDITFSDDPLRMIRAIRFASQLHFMIHPDTFEAIKRNKKRLKILSKERIIDEFNKIMSHNKPSVGLKLLFQAGLLDEFFPELKQLQGVEENDGKLHKDNFYHTLQVVDNVAAISDNIWLRWAALLHDIGKPSTKRYHDKNGWSFHGHEFVGSKMVPKIFKRLKLPLGQPMQYVQKMVLLSSRPLALVDDVTDSAVRRLLFEAGDDIEDLMLLCEADITTKNKRKYEKYRQNLKEVRQKLIEIEERDKVRNFQPPVSGEEIMQFFKLKPSKEVGLIKEAIKEAILEGTIPNEYEAAQKYMQKIGKEIIEKKS
ncbi:MAG: tRNA nucleotidyltransferase [Bacteroidetes bacterium]|nr:MAG: tRNA nucleotidyltransferase [Bacteroidota bacterium]